MLTEDRLLRSHIAFVAASHKLRSAVASLPPPDSAEMLPAAAAALADYSDVAAAMIMRTWGEVVPNVGATRTWWAHVSTLRKCPDDLTTWHHLSLAMSALTELGPQVWTYARMADDQHAELRSAHLQNVATFEAALIACKEGKPPPRQVLAITLHWISERGLERARRQVIAVITAHWPNRLPQALETIRAAN